MEQAESGDAMDDTKAVDRAAAVGTIRRQAEQCHPGDWYNRCGYVAIYGVDVLNQLLGGGYRVAGGMVEDPTSGAPRVLWPGSYGNSGIDGYRNFHAWIVGPAGEKIDCSVVPRSFDREFMWEPYETVPRLRYTEVAETTRKLEEVLQRVMARRNSGS
jgi:hypothetical protein